MPFAHEIVTFYDKHYQRDKTGKLDISPANAVEDVWDARNPAQVIAGLQTVLDALIRLTPTGKERDQARHEGPFTRKSQRHVTD